MELLNNQRIGPGLCLAIQPCCSTQYSTLTESSPPPPRGGAVRHESLAKYNADFKSFAVLLWQRDRLKASFASTINGDVLIGSVLLLKAFVPDKLTVTITCKRLRSLY
jgi:hypothetical protein